MQKPSFEATRIQYNQQPPYQPTMKQDKFETNEQIRGIFLKAVL